MRVAPVSLFILKIHPTSFLDCANYGEAPSSSAKALALMFRAASMACEADILVIGAPSDPAVGDSSFIHHIVEALERFSNHRQDGGPLIVGELLACLYYGKQQPVHPGAQVSRGLSPPVGQGFLSTYVLQLHREDRRGDFQRPVQEGPVG